MENGLTKSSVNGWDKARLFSERCLPREFYQPNTVQVAQDLLGKILVVRLNSWLSWDDPRACVTAGRIVETEAYRADDPASHSCRGPTPRSQIMFGAPGVAYVYLIYGMYEMLNFVTEPEGNAGAVLIRALEPLVGEEEMIQRRNCKNRLSLTNGPGRLCQAMGIKRSHGGQSLLGPNLYVCDDGYVPNSISISPRIGITVGVDQLWRFFITDHPFVSKSRKSLKPEAV